MMIFLAKKLDKMRSNKHLKSHFFFFDEKTFIKQTDGLQWEIG